MKTRFCLCGFAILLAVAAWSCSDVQNPTSTTGPAAPLTKPAMKAWQVPGDFATIQEAIDSDDVLPGQRIVVGPGNHAGANVTKAVEIKGEEGAVIDSGPLPWTFRTFMAGFLFNGQGAGSGATISHLRFQGVEFPVFSRGADDVTLEHCRMQDPIQGVTNWHGNGWTVSHNDIQDLRTSNGGGIGILCGCVLGGTSNTNLISHNKIGGTLHVSPSDGGGYCGTGIVLYADFRYYETAWYYWGYTGADEIANNRVVKNAVRLVSDTPEVVDVVALELTDTRDGQDLMAPDGTALPYEHIVINNAIGFNDLRRTTSQISLTPEDLDDVNSISRNLGKSRGHGLHPSAFGPGGY